MKQALYVALIAFAVSGCASPYTPTTDRPMDPITEFSTQNNLSIIYAQDSMTEFDTGRNIIANLKAWTGVVLKITEREVKKRGVRIEPGASRSLRLAVTKVRYTSTFFTLGTEIDMRVETVGRYSRTYTGKNSSGMVAVIKRQIDGAMMRVVAEMLKDPKIVSYLTQ